MELDAAMAELEYYQVAMIRQVVLVQLRRMLSLLEQIKMTQTAMVGASSAGTNDHFYITDLVKTCAEAILIEVVNEDGNGPDTVIREALTRHEFSEIVYTWTEELGFD